MIYFRLWSTEHVYIWLQWMVSEFYTPDSVQNLYRSFRVHTICRLHFQWLIASDKKFVLIVGPLEGKNAGALEKKTFLKLEKKTEKRTTTKLEGGCRTTKKLLLLRLPWGKCRLSVICDSAARNV